MFASQYWTVLCRVESNYVTVQGSNYHSKVSSNLSLSVRLHSLSLSLSDQEISGYQPGFLSQECERRKRGKKTGESDGSSHRHHMQSGN